MPSGSLQRFATVLITLWAGSLWAVCGLVAPSLFALLDDRQLAGQLAGHFFRVESVIGLVVGALLIALDWRARLALRGRALVWLAALLPFAGTVLLGPFLEQARSSGDMSRFALLHGISACCFLTACIALAIFVWRFNRPAE